MKIQCDYCLYYFEEDEEFQMIHLDTGDFCSVSCELAFREPLKEK